MASLPWDTIVNILIRLDVKDLLRYRSVSKQWCSLIDGPDFIKMHLNHSMETTSHLSLIREDRQLHSVDLDTLDSSVLLCPPIDDGGSSGIEVLGCCYGLVALSNSNEDMAIWNPSTREYRKVPISDLIELPFPGGIYEFGIVGFGYDSVNDDYKLLRMVHYFARDFYSYCSEVKVYSLKTKAWKRVGDFSYHSYKKPGISAFASGSLHWMVAQQPQCYDSLLIVAFDLAKEEYREISLPDSKCDKDVYTVLAELGEWLCLVCIYNENKKTDFVDIWVLKEYGVKEYWTKVFSVAPSNVNGVFKYVMPIVYLKSAHEVILDQDGEKFLLYDLERKRAKSVKKISGIPKCFDALVYVRSLVRLGDDDGKKAGGNGNKRKEQKQKPSGKRRDDFLSTGFKLVL